MIKFSETLFKIGEKLIIRMTSQTTSKPVQIPLINFNTSNSFANINTSANFKNNNFENNLINMIFKFFIFIIELDEKEICKFYIKNFYELIEILSIYKKVILIDTETIDKVSLMGSFGKKNNHRKYSLFLCTCFIRVNIIKFI